MSTVCSGVGAAEKGKKAARGKAVSSFGGKGGSSGREARHSSSHCCKCRGETGRAGGSADGVGVQAAMDGTVW